MARQDRYNKSGCLDMTAYLALRNIEYERRVKSRYKRNFNRKPVHYHKKFR